MQERRHNKICLVHKVIKWDEKLAAAMTKFMVNVTIINLRIACLFGQFCCMAYEITWNHEIFVFCILAHYIDILHA